MSTSATTRPARLRRLAAAMAAATIAAACAASPADPTRPGAVRGTLTVVGDPLPPLGAAGSQVYLLPSPDAAKTEAVRHAALAGGPRDYTFALDGVPPGRYYVQACLQLGTGVGCTVHPGGGTAPAAVDVRGGRTTDIAVRF